MKGYPDGSFRSDQAFTRAEMVVLINQVLRRGPLVGLDDSMWKDVALSHWTSYPIHEATLNYRFNTSVEGEQFVLETNE